MKCIFLAWVLITNASFGQLLLKSGNVKPGFISITRFDTTRPAVKEQSANDKGRIIQVNIWYPSVGGTTPMHFADYVGLVGKELDASSENKNWKQKRDR